MTTEPTINASEETIGLGELGVRFLLTGEDTNGMVSLFELTVPAGDKLRAPTHKNDAYEETLYGIEGVVTWTINGKAYEVGPGQSVCIPRGAEHRFENLGTMDAKQLTIITPPIMGPAYFHDVVEVLKASTGGPPDPVKMVDVFKRHGMTIAAPPAAAR